MAFSTLPVQSQSGDSMRMSKWEGQLPAEQCKMMGEESDGHSLSLQSSSRGEGGDRKWGGGRALTQGGLSMEQLLCCGPQWRDCLLGRPSGSEGRGLEACWSVRPILEGRVGTSTEGGLCCFLFTFYQEDIPSMELATVTEHFKASTEDYCLLG